MAKVNPYQKTAQPQLNILGKEVRKMSNREIGGDCTVLFSCLFGKIVSSGLSKQEFSSLKKHPIGHGSVQGFVDANLKAGNFQWSGNRLINTERRFLLDLNQKEIDKLRLRAYRKGLSEQDYIAQLVADSLGAR